MFENLLIFISVSLWLGLGIYGVYKTFSVPGSFSSFKLPEFYPYFGELADVFPWVFFNTMALVTCLIIPPTIVGVFIMGVVGGPITLLAYHSTVKGWEQATGKSIRDLK